MLLRFNSDGLAQDVADSSAFSGSGEDARSHPLFRGVHPRIVEAVLKSFVLITDRAPPAASKDLTPAEIEFVKQSWLSRLGNTARAAYDRVAGVATEDSVTGEELGGCDDVMPTEENRRNPRIYRFLNKDCCENKFGLKFADVSILQGRTAAESGCYNPDIGDHLGKSDDGRTVLLNAQGEPLAAGGPSKTDSSAGPSIKMSAEEMTANASELSNMMISAVLGMGPDSEWSGVRSDGRLLPKTLPPLSSWQPQRGVLVLVRRDRLPGGTDPLPEAELPTSVSDLSEDMVVVPCAPPDWPLVIPVPELKGNGKDLSAVCALWPECRAFHLRGFLYLSSPQLGSMPVGLLPPPAPHAAHEGHLDVLHVKKSFAGSHSAPEKRRLPVLPYDTALNEYVFFPGVFIPDDVPSEQARGSPQAPFSALLSATVERPNILAVDTEGKLYGGPLPAVNDWVVRKGASVLSGLFVRRTARVQLRLREGVMARREGEGVGLTAETLVVSAAQHREESLTAASSKVRGVPLVSFQQLMPAHLPHVHSRLVANGGARGEQDKVATALFESRLSESLTGKGEGDTGLVKINGASGSGATAEDPSGMIQRDGERLRKLAEEMATLAREPLDRVAAEVVQVQERLGRLRASVQAMRSAAMQHPSVNSQMLANLESQRASLQSLAKTIKDIIDLEMPIEVQREVASRSSNMATEPAEGDSNIAALARAGEMPQKRAPEFLFMLTAAMAQVLRDRHIPIRAVFLELVDGNSLRVYRDPHGVLPSATGGSQQAPSGLQVIALNIASSPSEPFCVQCILIAMDHGRKAYSILRNDAAGVAASDDAIQGLISGSAFPYQRSPVVANIPVDCGRVPNAETMWPMFLFNKAIAGSVAFNASASSTCTDFKEFCRLVFAVLDPDMRPGMSNTIRAAYSKIVALQAALRKCSSDATLCPWQDVTNGATVARDTLTNMQMAFAEGRYQETEALGSRVEVPITDSERRRQLPVASMFGSMRQAILDSPIPCTNMAQELLRREQGLNARAGCSRSIPNFPLSMLG